MKEKRVSVTTTNIIENLIRNGCNEDVLCLSVLDHSDPHKAVDPINLYLSVIQPFKACHFNKRVLVGIDKGGSTHTIEIDCNDYEKDTQTVIGEIFALAVPYITRFTDVKPTLTILPAKGRQEFAVYYDMVVKLCKDLGKTDEELFGLTEGLVCFMNDYSLNDFEIEQFVGHTEDECLIWDALNGTYTTTLEEYVEGKIKTPAIDVTSLPSVIYGVCVDKKRDGNIEEPIYRWFDNKDEAMQFIATCRNILLSDSDTTYSSEVVESEDENTGILSDNDGEFCITDGDSNLDCYKLVAVQPIW